MFAAIIFPPDYASGGQFRVRLSENAISSIAETFHCEVSINAGFFDNFGNPNQVELTGTAVTEYVLVPSANYSPGDVAGI